MESGYGVPRDSTVQFLEVCSMTPTTLCLRMVISTVFGKLSSFLVTPCCLLKLLRKEESFLQGLRRQISVKEGLSFFYKVTVILLCILLVYHLVMLMKTTMEVKLMD